MVKSIQLDLVKKKIVTLRNQSVILDSDVAKLYSVETKRINEAVKNNLDKFPGGYLFELSKEEWESLKSKFSTSKRGGKVKLPTAFTEKGLYMLATILKSAKATKTTITIIETFTKLREVNRIVDQLPAAQDNKSEQQKLLQSAGDIISDLIVPEGLESQETEASIELNFAVVKFKYSVKKKPRK